MKKYMVFFNQMNPNNLKKIYLKLSTKIRFILYLVVIKYKLIKLIFIKVSKWLNLVDSFLVKLVALNLIN